ncbi:Gldg family protein [Psychrosphaera sp. B3R10]|uniref:GldG family protein n=1 Tax=unclassified Psychrosphaera TaxID=2641570 RepID=UPI001C09012D|nr:MULTISPECIES: Gldg family protein [unclassified Psychrosphaera]MBU2881134.1 Gldg family protein [Psychrosphaera sp. I2R16]MBU2988239.1 Gldg family protein [Psychrosphaera sp. B3R10]MDO6718448.1 Gldg family protein [Psychrosphaera sp. 1_MG-2023]
MNFLKNKSGLVVSLGTIAIAFFALVLLNNVLFNKARLDLTEGGVYSISEGTHKILTEIDEPINLYFFYSNKATEGLTSLRNYAVRVQSLLEEYELYADGKIKLHIIDPEPFSEAEDKAAEMGLTAAPISTTGESVYLGLAATDSIDNKEIIAFFDPSQETLLEYEISKLIYRLTHPTQVKIALLSSLPMQGGLNPNPMAMQMGQPATTPAWSTYSQLAQLYDINVLEQDSETLPDDINLLILVHPKNLSENQLFAIDQYVLGGGKLLVFVDPNAESDAEANMMGMSAASSSDLARLFTAWGVDYNSSEIVLDAAKGLEIRMPDGKPGRHIGYLGLDRENIDGQDVVTTSLASINGASFGSLSKIENASTTFTPLFSSSEFSAITNSMVYSMAGQNPERLTNNFTPGQVSRVLAARVSGAANTAFETLPEGRVDEDWLKSADNIQVVVVADTDMLTDRFWVQTSNFFGQTILQPFANNGDFLINAVDNLSGSSNLLSIRGKGKYQRPFDVVEALTVAAEAKFREQEQRLQNELQQTESQLADLQSQQSESGALVLTAEQTAAVEQFVAKKLAIRKELRVVRHQLDKDIESLGSWLKFLNIAVFPLLLTLLLGAIAQYVRRQMMKQMQQLG